MCTLPMIERHVVIPGCLHLLSKCLSETSNSHDSQCSENKKIQNRTKRVKHKTQIDKSYLEREFKREINDIVLHPGRFMNDLENKTSKEKVQNHIASPAAS